MSFIRSNPTNKQQFSQSPLKLYTNQKTSQTCNQCGMKFQSIKQLLNHQRRFCMNSGYDNLTGLLMKQTNDATHRVNYKKQHFQNNKKNQTKMKNYGQLSLSKIKYQPELQDITRRKALMFYDDIKTLQKHQNTIQNARPYGFSSKFSQSHKKQTNQKDTSNKKMYQRNFQNSKSVSSFSYRLDQQNFNRQGQSKYAQNSKYHNYGGDAEKLKMLLLQNQPPKKVDQQQNIIHYKQNLPSQQYKKQFIEGKVNLLNKSNASIANMTSQQKYTYAKFKLDQLSQIKQLYFKNGGQSKEFKKNIQNMIQFYEKLLKDCQNQGKEEIQTQLSIASRPQTPIMKLNNIKQFEKNNKIHDYPNTGRLPHNQRVKDMKQISQPTYQPSKLQPNSYISPNQLYNGLQSHSFPSIDPNFYLAQNYANLYQMKVMEDMLKMKSQQNRKLIEALISNKKQEPLSQTNTNKKQKKQKDRNQQSSYRFAKKVNVNTPSEDRILKLLQQQQLDQLKLISQLPVNLQDEKLQSLKKNSELRFKMQKQILKQKLQKLSWQQKIQSFQEQRQLKNNQWVGVNNKDVIKTQMKSYIKDFQEQFLPGEPN